MIAARIWYCLADTHLHLIIPRLDTPDNQQISSAGTEEQIECITKHTKDATVLRSSYRFTSAEIACIALLAGFSEDMAGADFRWEHRLIQGRQLITPERIQAEWPVQ